MPAPDAEPAAGTDNSDAGSKGPRVGITPLIGEWAGQTRVACVADFPRTGSDTIEIFGAGIDVSNRALVGALREALSGGSGDISGFDLTGTSISGRVDLRISNGVVTARRGLWID